MFIRKRIVLAALSFLISVIGVVTIYLYFTGRQDMSAIDYIASKQMGKGVFKLGSQGIDVSSAEDLGFYIRDDEIELHYGEQVIVIKKKSLANKNFMDALKRIGITVQQKGEEYRIKYWGEVIDEWVK